MIRHLILTLAVSAAASFAMAEDGVPVKDRFPFYKAAQVDASNVNLTDSVWAPRQAVVSGTGIDWATRHFDRAGGFSELRENYGKGRKQQ